MKSPRKYDSAAGFRVALEDRLKKMAQEEGIDLQRLRRQAAFDRLLCRLFAAPDTPWLLKGGYAMELRLKTARTTRDIDLAMTQLPVPAAGWDANADEVLESLREAGRMDLRDFFTFVFGDATQDLDAAPYGGARFPVDARLAGRTFAKFHLDVSTGDVLREPYETLSGRENSRVKNLVNLVLLIERTRLDAARLPTAIRETFRRRKTHAVPSALVPPPVSWTRPFAEMAAECSLDPNMEEHFEKVAQFFGALKL